MASIFRKLKAYLYKNPVKPDPDEYIARISSERALDIKDICRSAVMRGGARVSPEGMQYNVELFLEEMSYLLCDSYRVDIGYFTARPKVKGPFRRSDTALDPKRHSLYFEFSQGKKMARRLDNANVKIVGMAKVHAEINRVTDRETGSINHLLTPGRMPEISGHKIKLAGPDPSVGIYFHNLNTGVATKAENDRIAVSQRSLLMMVIPMLPPGEYNIEILTQYSGSSIIKKPRSALFETPLRVE